MSSTPRYKFQGSKFSLLVHFSANSPANAIIGITNANPAVVHSTAHGRVDGDVVMISNDVVGMLEVNGKIAIVDMVDADHFKLLNVDSTNYGAYVSGGTFSFGTFSQFCAITSANRTGGTKTSIPVTDSCSTEEEFEVGLKGQGSLALDYNYAPLTDSVQVALEAWDDSGDMTAFKVQLPKNGGTITRLGFVQQTSDKGQVNGVWTGSATLLLTGKAFKQAAA